MVYKKEKRKHDSPNNVQPPISEIPKDDGEFFRIIEFAFSKLQDIEYKQDMISFFNLVAQDKFPVGNFALKLFEMTWT